MAGVFPSPYYTLPIMPSVLKTPLHQSFAIPTLVRVDPLRTGLDQPNLHTRWHPDIPCVFVLVNRGQQNKS